jgi:hypothetical protein
MRSRENRGLKLKLPGTYSIISENCLEPLSLRSKIYCVRSNPNVSILHRRLLFGEFDLENLKQRRCGIDTPPGQKYRNPRDTDFGSYGLGGPGS